MMSHIRGGRKVVKTGTIVLIGCVNGTVTRGRSCINVKKLRDNHLWMVPKVRPDVAKMLESYAKEGVLKGTATPKEQLELIGVTSNLAECLEV